MRAEQTPKTATRAKVAQAAASPTFARMSSIPFDARPAGAAPAAAPATADAAERFTYLSARSGTLLVGLGIAIVVETVAVHLWLAPRHPLVAWSLTTLAVASLAWLWRDHAAMGRGAVTLDGRALALRIGSRFAVTLDRDAILAATAPTWRELPEPADRAYVNLTKPAEPNVMLVLREPATVRLPGGLRRRCTRVGLHLDEPARFLAALDVAPTAMR